jgi:hypothetical protein
VPTTLLGHCNAGDTVVNVVSTVGFPTAGRINVKLPAWGILEFSYSGINTNQFLACTWTTPFTALLPAITSPVVPVVLTLPSNCTLSLAAALETTRLNTAFLQALSSRVAYVQNGLGAPKVTLPSSLVTQATAPQFYALIKNTTGVLQVQGLSNAATLSSLMADVAPAGSSLLIVPAHSISDVYMHTAKDNVVQQPEMTIEIVGPGDFVGAKLVLTAGVPQVLLQSSITDPSSSTPYTYSWTLTVNEGSGNEVLSSPNSPSTLLSNMTIDGNYTVTLSVSNSAGQTRVVNMIVTS